jgi:adenylosuccinate lyase
LVRGYAVTALENVALWHERDISHNSTERVIFPDACCLIDFMIADLTEIMDGLVVYPERMLSNMNASGGVIFSQRLLLALVESGMDRHVAYKLVQRHALSSWDGGGSFRDAVGADPEISSRLTSNEIDDLFDPQAQLMHVDTIFARAGLREPAMDRQVR